VDDGSSQTVASTERVADERLLIALRAGDERAFLTLVRAHHSGLVRVAERDALGTGVDRDWHLASRFPLPACVRGAGEAGYAAARGP
jgi:hypothetical protein